MKKDRFLITKNFLFLGVAQAIYKIFAFFTYILLARYLGVAGFGQFSFALSFVGLFAVCLDFGLSELLIRDVAGKTNELSETYVNNILSTKILLSVIGYILIAMFGLVFLKSYQLRILTLILALCLVLDSFTLFYRYIFRLFERMEFEALSLVSEGIFKLGLVFIMLKFFGIGVITVSYALLITSSIIFILTRILTLSRFVRLRLGFDYGFIKGLFKKSLPFAFLAFFGVINFKITTVIVSFFLDYTHTGLYAAAIRLIEPVLIIPVTVAAAIFPTISRLYKDSKKEAVFLYRASLKILFWVAIGVVLTLNIFATKVVIFVFGKEYLNAIASFRVLSLSLLPFFLKFFLERFLLVLNRPAAVISSYIFGTLIVIVAGSILAGKIGYLAAGISLVFSEFFIVGYNLVFAKVGTQCLSVKT